MTSNAKRKAFGPPTSVIGGILTSEQAGEQGGAPSTSKKTKIDQQSANEEDTAGDLDIEEQDRKRLQQGRKGRVVTDGYDSEDSSEEEEEDEEGSDADENERIKDGNKQDEDEDEDMFNLDEAPGSGDELSKSKAKKKNYLDLEDIEGQEFSEEGSEQGKEEVDAEFELEDDEEEDEEGEGQDMNGMEGNLHDSEAAVKPSKKSGKNGKQKESKKKGFQIEKFHMKNEMATGRFDEEGNYIENAKDPHAEHDQWLSGQYNRKTIQAAKEAQERRIREAKKKEERREFGDLDEDECKMHLVGYMFKGESVLGALQRLGALQKKKTKIGPGKKKNNGKGEAEPLEEQEEEEDVNQIKADLNKITSLASELMSRFGFVNVYEASYESLVGDVQKSGLVRSTWDPAAEKGKGDRNDELNESKKDALSYKYKWSNAYLKAMREQSGQVFDPATENEIFGPFNITDLLSWKKAGYFGNDGERILLQAEGQNDPTWSSWQDVFS